MTSTESRIRVTRQDGIDCVQFLDRNILDEPMIQTIGEELGRLIAEAPHPKVLIDFEAVEHLSSAALGMLINVSNKSKDQGGQLRLSSIDPLIYEVFTITKLDKLFQIHKTASEAIASFK